MERYIDTLKKIRLFRGLNEGEILASLECLRARVVGFKKGEYIFREGDRAGQIGAVLLGEIQIQKTDYEGNVNMIFKLLPPSLVAGAASFCIEKRLPFDVVALCESEILLIESERITRPCNKVCAFHTGIIENMLSVLSEKNIEFSQKIDILTKRTTREKVLAYLLMQARKSRRYNSDPTPPRSTEDRRDAMGEGRGEARAEARGEARRDGRSEGRGVQTITITLTRRQMAEYLSINRSALSRELSKMRDEGIIDFTSNHFTILK